MFHEISAYISIEGVADTEIPASEVMSDVDHPVHHPVTFVCQARTSVTTNLGNCHTVVGVPRRITLDVPSFPNRTFENGALHLTTALVFHQFPSI